MEQFKKLSLFLLLLIVVQLTGTAQITEQGLRDDLNKATMPKYPSNTTYSYTIWDDIPDMQSLGVGYMYNDTYPLTLQANYQNSYFSCLLDLGIGFNKNPQYNTPTKTLKTNFQATLSPGVYLKYVSVNFGVGCAFATTETNVLTITDVSAGNSSASASVSYSTTTVTGRLLLKPSITGYIPVDDDHFITISAGYNFAPNFKAINGFVFGVGFQFPID